MTAPALRTAVVLLPLMWLGANSFRQSLRYGWLVDKGRRPLYAGGSNIPNLVDANLTNGATGESDVASTTADWKAWRHYRVTTSGDSWSCEALFQIERLHAIQTWMIVNTNRPTQSWVLLAGFESSSDVSRTGVAREDIPPPPQYCSR
jgi:hypothetical protein